jgi:hypothetical protein
MLTALSVARDSGMVSPCDHAVLLTAHHVTDEADQKLALQWSPLSDIHDNGVSNIQELTGDEVEIRQVNS